MLPKAGGPYVYLRETYGDWAAFLFGWNELLFNRPGSIGALGMFFVGSLLATLDWQVGVWGNVLLAIGVIGVMAWVNYRGVVWGGAVQIATTLVKSLGVTVVAATPFLIYLATGGGIDAANYHSTLEAPVAGSRLGCPTMAWATTLGPRVSAWCCWP